MPRYTVKDYWDPFPGIEVGMRERAAKKDDEFRNKQESRMQGYQNRIVELQQQQETRLQMQQRDKLLAEEAAGMGYQGIEPPTPFRNLPAVRAGFQAGKAKREEDEVLQRQKLQLEADDMTFKAMEGLALTGYQPHPDESLTEVERAGFMSGAGKRVQNDVQEEERLRRLLETLELRERIEGDRARARATAPSPYNTETISEQDPVSGRRVTRRVPAGGGQDAASQDYSPPPITGVPQAVSERNRRVIGRIDPETGRFMPAR